jgi:putative redox protein
MVQARRREKFTIQLQIGKHSLTSDVATDRGGLDQGPTPHELVEAALAACTSMTIQMYADRKGWSLKSAEVQVRFQQDETKDPIIFERVLTLNGELDENQRQQLVAIADKCPVHKVLTRGAQIQTRLA